MKKNISIILLVLLPLFVFAQKNALNFKVKEYDFKTIKEEGGKVSCVFEFTNTGKVPILLNAVQASCGCTLPKWTKEPVLPNKKGIIKVTYNPANRPGKFTKTITVKTNVGTEKLMIKGVVTPRPKSLAEIYPKRMEQLRLKTSYVMFNEIGDNKQDVISVDVVNDSKEDIKVTFQNVPKYVKVKLEKEVLKPREKAVLQVAYDASKANFWGFHSDIIPVLVNGVKKASSNIVVTATVIEDFSKLTKKQREEAPVLGIDKFEMQFSNVVAGDKVKAKFKITNVGKSPLLIRKVETSSEAIQVEISKEKIAPNTQEFVTVTFDTKGKNGYQNQQITLITNAPDLPVVNLRLSGVVE